MRTKILATGSRADHGFTLLEVLVALVILSLSTLALGAVLGGDRNKTQLLQASSYVDQALLDARAMAQRQGRTASVIFDVNRRLLRRDKDTGWTSMPEDVEVFITSARELGIDLPAIAFFSDGTSSGGIVTLRSGAHSIQRRVDWLTGAVHGS